MNALGLRPERPSRVRYDGREEILSAGAIYHMEPRHTTLFEEDTQLVEFSPKGEYDATIAVVAGNMAAMQASK